MSLLQDKVAIITGGGSGIGRAVSLHYAKLGAKIVVSDFNTEIGEETVSLIRKENGVSIFIRADVSKSKDIQNLFESTLKEWGKIDIVCNNAGIGHPHEDLFSDGDIWNMIVSVNLSAVIEGTKLALRYMKGSGGGVVINTASLAAYFSTGTTPVYAATKAGVANFTRAIKSMAADCGVKVSAVCPGFIKTNMGVQVPFDVVKRYQGTYLSRVCCCSSITTVTNFCYR
eukprot:TRINITY_DN10473_c0_g1_i2.p1 TRINITY_DN10473_c0_g1~~TRINITY_DN10473_c0_g1_i2.p1  ORF type:complete len:228 (-),score=32.49 TRINITY_DN10473_c0_g1_i2:254-937(-)